MDRRSFLEGAIASGAAIAVKPLPAAEAKAERQALAKAGSAAGEGAIDFRYAPAAYQTAFCFPDDPHKSLVSESGQLLYGFDNWGGVHYFPMKIGFGLRGMKSGRVTSQKLDGPAIPIVRTMMEYDGAAVLLTTFATNESGEGRVDNVILDVTAETAESIDFQPMVIFDAMDEVELDEKSALPAVVKSKTHELLMVGKVLGAEAAKGAQAWTFRLDIDRPWRVTLHRGKASKGERYRAFFRFPQEGQSEATLAAGVARPDELLANARRFWTTWRAFSAPVDWKLPGRRGEFVEACARNILQAREVKNGKLTFQVGPTCYRGLWVVDGNFILEAARYLGLDKEAVEGLRTTWAGQLSTGQVTGGGGKEHWKDTAIAMFTLVRQCELSQDWSLLREYEPQVAHAIAFLRALRAEAVSEDSALGRYGLLARGFADGGVGGLRDEFTNTLWALAGLKAMAEAAEQQRMPGLADARKLHDELKDAFAKAAPQEMRRYESGFEYLPMVLKSDPEWNLEDAWDRLRPQGAQWALSHAIFPGRVFEPQDRVVQGHTRLMQAVTKEGIPSDTGWNQHHSVWNYNAPFVAEVYLWLGMRQAAHDTFIAFLNHASSQYCWREEQPLQNALVLTYVGDMPHNWASAECIRYLRHMLALEDGAHLRLLAGMTGDELAGEKPYVLTGTPTRFGRLNLTLEPLDHNSGWRLAYEREMGPAPEKLSLPAKMGAFRFERAEGAQVKADAELITVEPAATRWSAIWRG